MLESGIINYGDDFLHSMEEGGWDLSKVDAQNERIKSFFCIRPDERTQEHVLV